MKSPHLSETKPICHTATKHTGTVSYLLSLGGVVQGVGFRPWVYHMATAWGFPGQVSNGPEGVRIVIQAGLSTATAFCDTLLANLPPNAVVSASSLQPYPSESMEGFSIVESREAPEGCAAVPAPDLATCPGCLSEMRDPLNRRFRYPFITCTNCGPRYSILEHQPFDRPATAMRHFRPCSRCEAEYLTPHDRRFHAQTNSCPDCGPSLSWHSYTGGRLLHRNNEAVLAAACAALQDGETVAVKGLGGYLLLCDATNPAAVANLRARKKRPGKPFAMLCADMDMVRALAEVAEDETAALKSPMAPIVLLRRRTSPGYAVCSQVAPHNSHWGLMLPSAPLLHLLAGDCGFPLVATSANLSGSPIIHQEAEAFGLLTHVARFFLTHDRPVPMPQDDSVLGFSRYYRQPVVFRRGRGFVLDMQTGLGTTHPAFAFGASQKSTFAIRTQSSCFLSQYIGDLASYDTQERFQDVLSRFMLMTVSGLVAENAVALSDMHPGYPSTDLALAFAQEHRVTLKKIQHHQAHFAAVLAEHGLTADARHVLGVIWDGTGLGTDGQIWGGEFFYAGKRAHLAYFPVILADKMVKEPRLSALALLSRLPGIMPVLHDRFTPAEWALYGKMLKSPTLQTSSMGRLFDGVAALLGLSDRQAYEGEAAIRLESAADQFLAKHGLSYNEHYPVALSGGMPQWQPVIKALLEDIGNGLDTGEIAARFHLSLVQWVLAVARHFGAGKIAFSGGVFQNRLLVDLLIHRLSPGFSLYFHQKMPPNDENIAFGQLIIHQHPHLTFE